MMPRWVQLTLWALAAVVVWQLVRGGLVDQERQVRTRLKEAAEQAFPTEAAAARERYGLMRLHEAQEGRAEIVLIHGLDDIGLTLEHVDEIGAYEQRRQAEAPWLFA